MSTITFEEEANDVAISTLSQVIEIDLKQCLEETDVPGPLKPIEDVLY